MLTKKQSCNGGLQILRRRHLFVVSLTTLSISHTACHMIQLAMNCEDMKRSSHDLNGSIMAKSACTD
jgi:hypothetical protein